MNWKPDETVRSGLNQFADEHKWTRAKLAAKLGVTATRVSKYLNLEAGHEPESDMPKVEAAARHFLRHHHRQQSLIGALFENQVARDVSATLRQIRRTGDIGLIYSKAGLGKTCGAMHYCLNNPNTLFLTVKQYSCGAGAIRRMTFNEYCHSTDERWPGNVPTGEWLEQQLRGTERLVIYDDAEFMHITGFRFCFSLHDATGIPMAFIGNREILDTLRRSDSEGKLISRVGMVHQVESGDDEEETARKLIKQFAPESNGELEDEAVNVLTKAGSCRRLRKQLVLAAHLREALPKESWTGCFQLAAARLLAA